MASFTLTIKVDNDAFTDMEEEIASILRDLARNMQSGRFDQVKRTNIKAIYDSNGNRVGVAKWPRRALSR